MPLQHLRAALHEEHRETYVEYAKARNKLLARMTCLGPGCDCPALNSHSQQRAVALKAIAEKSHVYALKRSTTFCDFCSVGIREASTFKGFCAQRDAALFAALELAPLTPGNVIQVQQAFLRATAHECVRKKETALAVAAVSTKMGGPEYQVADIWLSFPEIERYFMDALAGTLKLGWIGGRRCPARNRDACGLGVLQTIDEPRIAGHLCV